MCKLWSKKSTKCQCTLTGQNNTNAYDSHIKRIEEATCSQQVVRRYECCMAREGEEGGVGGKEREGRRGRKEGGEGGEIGEGGEREEGGKGKEWNGAGCNT